MERKDYKRYSREFKLEAVRLASLGVKPKAQIDPRPGYPSEPKNAERESAAFFAS